MLAHLNLNPVAWKILRELQKSPSLKKLGHHVSASAWYNGRERGVCLVVRHPANLSGPGLVIVFGEHRNSDDAFVDSWTMSTLPWNPPTITDEPEEAYDNRVFVLNRPDMVRKTTRIVLKTIHDFLKAAMKEVA